MNLDSKARVWESKPRELFFRKVEKRLQSTQTLLQSSDTCVFFWSDHVQFISASGTELHFEKTF